MKENNDFKESLGKLIHTAGTLKLKKEEKEALYKEILDEDILIKTDGTVYLPWTAYVARLNAAFGGTGWALVPQGDPYEKDKHVYSGFYLIIRGCYCGYAVGQVEYNPSAEQWKTWGDAMEAAKSNALMRLCKELGIGLKMWDKTFVQEWQAKNAYQVKGGKWYKGPKPEGNEDQPAASRDANVFERANLDNKLAEIATEEALGLEWTNLGEELQKNPRVAQIFRRHVLRVRAMQTEPAEAKLLEGVLPLEKVKIKYTLDQGGQEEAIRDLQQEIGIYKTGAELEEKKDAIIINYIKAGFMAENRSIMEAVIQKTIKEKRLGIRARRIES